MVLTYNGTQASTRLAWVEPGIGNLSDSSYLLCQMNWHTVRLTKKNSNITLVLDEFPAVSAEAAQRGGISGGLYLGGLPGLCVLRISF